MPPSKSLPLTATRTSSASAAMPHDEVEADQLASSHLTGTHHRAIVRAAALRGVWRSVAFSQAVAIGRRYWQAAGAQRVIIRRGAFGNSVKQLQQKIGTFKQSPSLPDAYLPLTTGTERELATPGVRTHLAWCGIPFPLFTSAKGTRAGPQAPPGRLITSRPTPGSASTDTPLLSDRRTWS